MVDVVVNPKVAISVLDEAKAMGIENIFSNLELTQMKLWNTQTNSD